MLTWPTTQPPNLTSLRKLQYTSARTNVMHICLMSDPSGPHCPSHLTLPLYGISYIVEFYCNFLMEGEGVPSLATLTPILTACSSTVHKAIWILCHGGSGYLKAELAGSLRSCSYLGQRDARGDLHGPQFFKQAIWEIGKVTKWMKNLFKLTRGD